jgi:peroxidase
MQNYSLHSQPHGYTYQYDAEINPSITNAFSTAALRFGHTLIQGFMQ